MHKYMSAIGFHELMGSKKLQELLTEVIINADRRAVTKNAEGRVLAEFCKDFADGIGIAVCGEFENDEKFIFEYYYPYLTGTGISSTEDVTVERHAEKDSYAGVCDDIKVGLSLIFYLQNRIPYVKAQTNGMLPIRGTTVTMTGLSTKGTILLPVMKDPEQVEKIKKATTARMNLMEAARRGDEEAIETLTLEDMDLYTNISKRVKREDIFTIVDTYLMPWGVETDQYSVLGEIVGMRTVTNEVTGEQMYILKLFANELTFEVSINIIDLLGEPRVGRRFRGIIWLQGSINFPEESLL